MNINYNTRISHSANIVQAASYVRKVEHSGFGSFVLNLEPGSLEYGFIYHTSKIL
jgi:hypothetical protein